MRRRSSIPVLRMSAVESAFTLADITDTDRFRKLGASLAANPDGELARTLVSARIVVGPDGIKRTELVTSGAADEVRSIPTLFALEDLRNQLVEMVLGSPAVPARKDQRAAVAPAHRRVLHRPRGRRPTSSCRRTLAGPARGS